MQKGDGENKEGKQQKIREGNRPLLPTPGLRHTPGRGRETRGNTRKHATIIRMCVSIEKQVLCSLLSPAPTSSNWISTSCTISMAAVPTAFIVMAENLQRSFVATDHKGENEKIK